MDKPIVFLVINPISGVSNPDHVRQRFEAIYGEAGWETRVYITTGTENLSEIIHQAIQDGASRVVAAGGDGTVSEVGSALAYTGISLGIIPTGTWNALAHNLAIPIVLNDALNLQVEPHTILPMDTLKIGDRHFLLNVGIGLSASVIQSTRRVQKRRFGFLAYIWNMLIQVFGIRLRPFRVTIDGNEHKIKVSELMVVNSSIIGLGELPTVLDIYPSDGKVEVLGLRAPTVIGLVSIALNFLIGRKKQTQGFITFTATRSIIIRTRKPLVVQADGEIIGRTPVEIHLQPAAVQTIIPAQNG